MTRRRRAVLLLGLATMLGALAASDVARREAAIDRQLGPNVAVVVARRAIAARSVLKPGALALRQVPSRYAPVGAAASLVQLEGERAAVAIPAGGYVTEGDVDSGAMGGGPDLGPGERAAELIAVGDAAQIQIGGRVDVLITRQSGDGSHGQTRLALEDVEVLDAAPAPAEQGDQGAAPRVRVSLRVTLHEAVFLAAAQAFAHEIRLLPRAAGDTRRGDEGIAVGDNLG
jgi:pilus assembly protein CpaB